MQQSGYVGFLMLAGGKKEREGKRGRGKIHSPLQPSTRAPECWQVESEREEKESCPFKERKTGTF
jgi:hypothetical protein